MEWYAKRDDSLEHHGIDGQKWGIRNGPPYPLDSKKAERIKRRLEKKDTKWAHKKENKFYKQTFRKSAKEMNRFTKNLTRIVSPTNKDGTPSAKFFNAYNQKLSEVMNKNMKEVRSPSGKVVRWVAKRGGIGVHMALADPGYNMNQVRNGVYSGGRIAYRKDTVGTA